MTDAPLPLVTIIWRPPADPADVGAVGMPGWCTAFEIDGQLVCTVAAAAIHVTPDAMICAELEMFADEDDQPILSPAAGGALAAALVTEGEWDEARIKTRKFIYTVADMRMASEQPVSAP